MNAKKELRKAAEENLHDAHAGVNGEFSRLEAKLAARLSPDRRYEKYRTAVCDLLRAGESNPSLGRHIKGVLAGLVQTGPEFDLAIETAFGCAMQYVVTDTAAGAGTLIGYLKRTHGGMVVFLPAADMKPTAISDAVLRACGEKGAIGRAANLVQYDAEYENLISVLLGNVLVCDDLKDAIGIAEKYRGAFRIVTSDGCDLRKDGTIGYRSGGKEGYFAAEREIRRLKAEIARLKSISD